MLSRWLYQYHSITYLLTMALITHEANWLVPISILNLFGLCLPQSSTTMHWIYKFWEYVQYTPKNHDPTSTSFILQTWVKNVHASQNSEDGKICPMDTMSHSGSPRSYYMAIPQEYMHTIFRKTLQWRHNERDGVSNHQSRDCLLKRLFSGADRRKHQSSASLAFVRGIHRGPVNSPHKWPVARKTFHSMTSSWHAHGFALLGCFCYITSSTRIVIIYPGTFLLTQAYWHNGCPGACEVTLADIGKTLQVPNPNHSLDLELVKFSRYHRNGKVVRVTALVVNGVVEACLQRLLWRPGQSSWRPSRFNV